MALKEYTNLVLSERVHFFTSFALETKHTSSTPLRESNFYHKAATTRTNTISTQCTCFTASLFSGRSSLTKKEVYTSAVAVCVDMRSQSELTAEFKLSHLRKQATRVCQLRGLGGL